MPTPVFMRFSRIPGAPFDAMNRVDRSLRRIWRSTLREVVRLEPSYSDYDGGLRLAGDLEECDRLDEAKAKAGDGGPFALVYLAHDVPAEFYFYLFDITAEGFSISLVVESSLVYHEDPEYESGGWLEGLFTTIVCELKPVVCGYGRDSAYELKHEALDADVVMARLRSGELLSLPRPIFHAISCDLIAKTEIDALIAKHRPEPSPDYRLAGRHHILGRVGL